MPATIAARDVFASIDWSRTSLGPLERWPQRLRATVEIVLANRFPMVVLWGPDVVQVAYNDAYARLIGSRHPGAMGQKNETIWPEVWHINAPIYEAVLRTGRDFYFEDALYPLERNDSREEVYLTVSYGPIRGDDGQIGGILATMVETTRNVLAERRLRSLRELASRTARLRSIAEIGSIAVNVLAENTGDVLFALVFAADARREDERETIRTHLLGCAGLDERDARDLETVARAVTEEGASALMRLGTRANGEPYEGGALGQPVRNAYAAALPRVNASSPRGWFVIGLSPALPPDDRYREYLELISAQLAVAFENATAFSREHRIADTLQHAALPETLPHFAGLAVDAVYEPGSAEALIGGDWYDAFALHDGRVVISIGDVSGSGVVAAAAMGAARQMIRGLAQTLDNPVDVLNAVDRAFRIEKESLITTAFVGVLDAGYRHLAYASAGHPPPFVRHADGRIQALSAPDLPIGLRDGRSSAPSRIDLNDGSIVVLYTDGLTEATHDPIAGEARLLEALASDDFPAQPHKAAYLYGRVLERSANDDVALLVIELPKSSSPCGGDDESNARPSNAQVRWRGSIGAPLPFASLDDRKKGDEVRLMAKGKEAKKEKKKPKKDAVPKPKAK